MPLKKQPFYRKRIFAYLYLLLIVAAGLFLGSIWSQQKRFETDLNSLLPAQSQLSVAQQQAEARMSQRMNRDMVIVLGSESAKQAEAAAMAVENLWRQSGLFQTVTGNIEPDVTQVQAQIQPLQLASVPSSVWQEIQRHPEAAFAKQAMALVNPFAQTSVLPIEQDWLGLSGSIVANAQQDSPVFWNAQTGWLTIEQENKTWIVLRARLPEQAGLINVPDGLLGLIQNTQNMAKQQNVEVLMAGGAIFAAENKAIGEQESRYMSGIGLVLTFVLLLLVFRSSRILWLLLPLSTGVILGLMGTILVFGHVHMITLVIGTSLVGVLLDFPLHWLCSGLVQPRWQRWQALHVASKAFVLSLVITLVGYLVLLVTPLPILQQTAVFSSLALVGSFLATLLWLPHVTRKWTLQAIPWLSAMLLRLNGVAMRVHEALLRHSWLMVILFMVTLVGVAKVNTQDDMRQWVNLSPVWLEQAAKIGQLTQMQATGQYFLVLANTDDELLMKEQALTQKLDVLVQKQVLGQFQALSQWVSSKAIQKQRQQDVLVLAMQPNSWESLQAAGVDDDSIKTYLQNLSKLPAVSIEDSLRSDMAGQWQDLYLGDVITKEGVQKASIVSLSNLQDVASVSALRQPDNGIVFVDQRRDLNRLFVHTRNIAITLKLASYLAAIVLLAWVFGVRKGLLLLAVPLLASLMSVAVFGYVGWSLSLFAIFGLFLVTAIGMDYAIYVSMQKIALSERLAGMLLAAMTTMISFAILGFSATPAIAAFGRSVALGVFFSVVLALVFLPNQNKIK